VSVPNIDFKTIKADNLQVHYSDEYQNEAQKAIRLEQNIIQNYEDSFGYKFDESMHVGIFSSKNQVPNAYSTQIPLNLQHNFVGGALLVDEMCFSSWLKGLLYHESAHNYQLNPKKNVLSHFSHKYFGNLPFTFLFIVPVFPLPNTTISSFLLEGNAVLNESTFNNGGRLYSGKNLALVMAQAKAGYLTPERTYNSHLFFPYTTHHYIVGGFFQLFLAQKYGVDRVNSYFYTHSGQWLPFFTNIAFKDTFENDFESELKEFNEYMLKKHKEFNPTDAKILATSTSHKKFNSNKNEIFFLTSDGVSKPTLITISKNSKRISKQKGNWFMGEVFKIDNDYYTSSFASISAQSNEIALFNKDRKVLKDTHSKAIQGVLSDGKIVYIDVPQSYFSFKLYVGDMFYDTLNSTAFVDEKDNIYYFKQNNKIRTLYKNKKPIFSYKGWFGHVCDVDENGVLFIGASEHGSTLYRYNGKVERLSNFDDIVDAKILGDELLIATIGADSYRYYKISPTVSSSDVFEYKFFFEDNNSTDSQFFKIADRKPEEYSEIKNFHYSSLEKDIIASDNGINFSIKANFEDPLLQNKFSIFSKKTDDETIAGVGYQNSKNRLNYGFDIYGVIEHDNNISSRGFGAMLNLEYPLYATDNKNIDLSLTYLLDYDRDERLPLTLALNYSDAKHYGHSFFVNDYKALSLFVSNDRDDILAGIEGKYMQDLSNEFYFSLSGKYVKADLDSDKNRSKRGIKIDNNYGFDKYTTIKMPSLKNDLYTKEALVGEVGVYKTFNFSSYFFSFPLSLRREALYSKYRYYDFTFRNDYSKVFNEIIVGLKADLLFFNNFPIPLSFEYIQNDDLKESNNFNFEFGYSF
jgi:hypothetical protein